jgi:cell division protein ZapA (FtsZ GTPase activity inhibitor)
MSARRASTGPLTRRFRSRKGAPQPRRRRQAKLIGRDIAEMPLRSSPRSRLLHVAILGAVIAGLCLAALRNDLIRQRYELAEAMDTEKQLLEQKRLLTAQSRRLHDPARLARLAAKRGFVRPERLIDIKTLDVAAGPRP